MIETNGEDLYNQIKKLAFQILMKSKNLLRLTIKVRKRVERKIRDQVETARLIIPLLPTKQNLKIREKR
jgi:hypothetical protein